MMISATTSQHRITHNNFWSLFASRFFMLLSMAIILSLVLSRSLSNLPSILFCKLASSPKF